MAKLDSAKERLRLRLTQLSSSGPASAGKGFPVPLDAPLSGSGCSPSVLGLSSRSNNYVLVSQINLASPSPRGWLPFLQLASRHRIITAEPSEAAKQLNSPKSQGASRSGDGVPCSKAGRTMLGSENAPELHGLPRLMPPTVLADPHEWLSTQAHPLYAATFRSLAPKLDPGRSSKCGSRLLLAGLLREAEQRAALGFVRSGWWECAGEAREVCWGHRRK